MCEEINKKSETDLPKTMTNAQKAHELIAEAVKKLDLPKTFLGSLFGASTKLEDVAERYRRAGNLFKMDKDWTSAGDAFVEAAKIYTKVNYRLDIASTYTDAANCYKKVDKDKSVNCLLRAIEVYTDMGRFSLAGKHHQKIAELYEDDVVNLEKATQHYEQAVDYYRGEENNSSANKCALKVAQYSAQAENYDKAIVIYEEVTSACLECSLLKYNAKEYTFRAVLCHLCVDVLNGKHAMAKYIEKNPAFQDSREYTFLQKLIASIEEQNVDAFTEVVTNFDSVSRFDQWYTMMLLRIKKTIDGNPDLR